MDSMHVCWFFFCCCCFCFICCCTRSSVIIKIYANTWQAHPILKMIASRAVTQHASKQDVSKRLLHRSEEIWSNLEIVPWPSLNMGLRLRLCCLAFLHACQEKKKLVKKLFRIEFKHTGQVCMFLDVNDQLRLTEWRVFPSIHWMYSWLL